MYCRCCHYDLRGQDVARCSECGRDFDPTDPATFLEELPAWYDLLARLDPESTRRTFCVLISVVCTIVWLLSISADGQVRRCWHPSQGDFNNLEHIVKVWKGESQAGRFPPDSTPDQQASLFERRFSPFQQRDDIFEQRAWVRWAHSEVGWPASLILVNSFLLIPLTRDRARKAACCCATLATIVLVLSILAEPISRNWWRGDRAYLSDYDYLPNQEWTSDQNTLRLAAWPRPPLRRQHRYTLVGACSDGTVRELDHETFHALLSAELDGMLPFSPNAAAHKRTCGRTSESATDGGP